MSKDNVQLAWALVGGQLRHIRDFCAIPPGRRPAAQCELCGADLIMKLGPVLAHHYSHKSSSRCPLTAPETARHYNSKQGLASKLRSAESLSVVTKCSHSLASARCVADLTSVAAEGWDEVRVEPFIDPVRPDILLLKSGVPALAIEVCATNAVSESKAARLSELQLPWIEVGAGRECDDWVTSLPLRVIRHESGHAPKFCSKHSVSSVASPVSQERPPAGAVVRRRRRPVRLPAEDLPYRGDRWKFRVVDCYPARGERVRKVFWVYCHDVRTTCCLRLVDESALALIAELKRAEKNEQTLRQLHRLLIAHLRRSFVRYHSAERWRDAAAFPANGATVYRKDYMPVKYIRDASGTWVEQHVRRDV